MQTQTFQAASTAAGSRSTRTRPSPHTDSTADETDLWLAQARILYARHTTTVNNNDLRLHVWTSMAAPSSAHSQRSNLRPVREKMVQVLMLIVLACLYAGVGGEEDAGMGSAVPTSTSSPTRSLGDHDAAEEFSGNGQKEVRKFYPRRYWA